MRKIEFWEIDKIYKKGDVVFTFGENPEYYICSIEHLSCELVYPNSEDVYWIKIEDWVTQDIVYREKMKTYNTRYNQRLKRKLLSAENEIEKYKKQKTNDPVDNLRDNLLLLNVDVSTKSYLLDKYEGILQTSGSDYSKGKNWMKTVCSIPFGKTKTMRIKATDNPEKINKFLQDVKAKLDEKIYGLDKVKQEIIEFVARKISNPNGKGHVLALYGNKGLGKTKIIKSLADALEIPFYQINFGGLNDSSILLGHSETYVSAKHGKIIDGLVTTGVMNPIFYLDEIDKISEHRSKEINGVLTHLLDEEQNNKFNDNYLSNVNIDLSKILFVIAFNDITKVDAIVSDRMKLIYIDPPSLEDKVNIVQEKIIPEIITMVNFPKTYKFIMSKELLEYIITQKTVKEDGVRQLKKGLEKIFNKLNYEILINKLSPGLYCDDTVITVEKLFVDNVLESNSENQDYLSMYN
jgi:ATP-dependent Lon protease